ncbi:MAG: hypothetical protein ACRERC_20680 [Candidatus Binatia bacterium]
MAHGQVTRREFLLIGGAVVAGGLTAGRATAVAAPQGATGPVTIYRLSVRGRRGSNAAKLHNANLLFATAEAADANRAHPGDHSRVVSLVVNADEFDRLFTSRDSLVADLRSIGGPVLVGDCNRDGEVAINELIRGVNIALGGTPVSECLPFDRVADGQVSVTELIRGVRNALG